LKGRNLKLDRGESRKEGGNDQNPCNFRSNAENTNIARRNKDNFVKDGAGGRLQQGASNEDLYHNKKGGDILTRRRGIVVTREKRQGNQD